MHKNIHVILHHVSENGHHASLKCSLCIAQSKGHQSEGKCPIWACEYGFFLVFMGLLFDYI